MSFYCELWFKNCLKYNRLNVQFHEKGFVADYVSVRFIHNFINKNNKIYISAYLQVPAAQAHSS